MKLHDQIKKMANKAGQAFLVYQDDEFKVLRSDYAGADKVAYSELVGVYRGTISKQDLLDDIESYLSERVERQARQSRILAEQMGFPG